MNLSLIYEKPPTVASCINLDNYDNFKLPTLYQTYMATDKYARWNDEEKRRENWPETVKRYVDWLTNHLISNMNYTLSEELQLKIFDNILNLKVLPSMRALMTAGKALELDNVAGYNCAFLSINRVSAFKDATYVLFCGGGVGFSVERQHINSLPNLPDELVDVDYTIVVEDSKIGWCDSIDELINLLYKGQIPKWDTSKVRPAGAKIKTFGGRASGPLVLENLFKHIVNIFKSAKHNEINKLTSYDCHSIMCKIGDCVVSGGVRRSAMISLSNLSDNRMRNAKSGEWWTTSSHFALANNSAVYDDKPNAEIFMEEWLSLIRSKSGERGIFNRQAAQKKASSNGRRNGSKVVGTNPCSEILLRDRQFCNLTSITNRADDSFDEWMEKIEIATIIGTFQTTLTFGRSFDYLSPEWKKNCEEERLLGVSLNGIYDSIYTNGMATREQYLKWTDGKCSSLENVLSIGRDHAIRVNKKLAKALKIKQSAAITCVKPEGTASQLVNCGSGLHPQHDKYYIRTNRANKISPVAQLMKDSGIPCEDEITYPDENGTFPESTKYVFSFPMKAPEGAITRNDIQAIDHLKLWSTYAEYWCEHKPSITVSVRDTEWMQVDAFVYDNFDKMTGVAFLPMTDHIYQQAPYQECTKEEYEALLAKMPKSIPWHDLHFYEKDDTTTSSRELACVAGAGGVWGCE